MDYFNQISIDLVVNIVSALISAFIIFIVGATILIKPWVKISKIIAHGKNYQTDKLAYKFKIVNKSSFIAARDFEIHLYSIKKVKSKIDNTYSTYYNHENEFKIRDISLKSLEPYKPKFLLFLIRLRKSNKKYTTRFTFHINTLDDINKYRPKFNALRLVVLYTDSLNKRQFVMQDFDLDDEEQVVFEGSFADDGSLNKIILREDDI